MRANSCQIEITRREYLSLTKAVITLADDDRADLSNAIQEVVNLVPVGIANEWLREPKLLPANLRKFVGDISSIASSLYIHSSLTMSRLRTVAQNWNIESFKLLAAIAAEVAEFTSDSDAENWDYARVVEALELD
jgi:hypothetical protein